MIRQSDSWKGLEELEKHWEEIRAEFDLLKPYIKNTAYQGRHILDLRYHEYNSPYLDQIPVTRKLMEAIPGILSYGFTYVEPKGFVWPHTDHDFKDTVMTGSLCLYGEGNTGLCVGEDVRVFRPGEVLVHDGSRSHIGWNASDQDRCNLNFQYATGSLDVSQSIFHILYLKVLNGEIIPEDEAGTISDIDTKRESNAII